MIRRLYNWCCTLICLAIFVSAAGGIGFFGGEMNNLYNERAAMLPAFSLACAGLGASIATILGGFVMLVASANECR